MHRGGGAQAAAAGLCATRGTDPAETCRCAGRGGSAKGKDTRLTLKDIEEQIRRHVAPEQVADNAAEQGRGFEVTAEVAKELRGLGLSPAQIDAVKESSPEPIVPGKGVWASSWDDERKNRFFEAMRQVAADSGTGIRPVQSQHVTLWVPVSATAGSSGSAELPSAGRRPEIAGQAGEESCQPYLRDVKKLEKFFHTKCAEPLRSGLDKRCAHVVLLKDHADYEAWCRAASKLVVGKSSLEADIPRYAAVMANREGYCVLGNLCVFSVGEPNFTRRLVVGCVGYMYFFQTVGTAGGVEEGFFDWVETAVFGSPSLFFDEVISCKPVGRPDRDSHDWRLLVRQRMATHQATPPIKLLRGQQPERSTPAMQQAFHAEAWTLVELLSKQPAKFGTLLLEIKKHSDDTLRGGNLYVAIAKVELAAIKKVYGWDEKELTEQWRAYVMGEAVKGPPKRPKPDAAPAETDERSAEVDTEPAEDAAARKPAVEDDVEEAMVVKTYDVRGLIERGDTDALKISARR